MPVTGKGYYCVISESKDPSAFQGGRKTCCKLCMKITTYKDRRPLILLPYECVICGDKDEKDFYRYCKNKCRKHYNFRSKAPLQNVKINIVKAPKVVGVEG